MITFLYLLIIELKADIPHWGIIRVEPKNSDEDCSSNYGIQENYKKKCSKYPKEFGGPDECNRVMKPYAGYKCFFEDGESAVNNALSQVDSSLEFLIVDNAVPRQKIDFNKLPSQMVVQLNHPNLETNKILSIQDSMLKTNFDGSLNGYVRLSKELAKIQPKEADVVRIVGNISEKVSNLILTLQTIQIVDSDLNVDNFILASGTLDHENSPYKISSNTFITEISQGVWTEKINAKRKGYYYYDELAENISISFDIGFKENNESSEATKYPEITHSATRPSDPEHDYTFHGMEYEFDQILDIITNGKAITFKFNEHFVEFGPNNVKLNLTIDNYQPHNDPTYQLKWGSWSNSRLLAKEELKINYEGNWSLLPQKFNINLNYDKNLYEIDTSELEKVATVTKTDLFQFKTSWSEEKKKKNIGLIVGVTVACVVVVAIIVVVVIFVFRRKRRVQTPNENSVDR